MSDTTASRPVAPGPGNAASSQWPSGHPRRRLILLVLCLSLLVVVIDNTILNTALPTLARVLHAGTGSLQWISDAYTLCFAALLIPEILYNMFAQVVYATALFRAFRGSASTWHET